MATASAKTKEYRTLVGLNFGPTDKRYEPDEIVPDLPAESVEWLLSQGYIRLTSDDPAPEDVATIEGGPSTEHLPTNPTEEV